MGHVGTSSSSASGTTATMRCDDAVMDSIILRSTTVSEKQRSQSLVEQLFCNSCVASHTQVRSSPATHRPQSQSQTDRDTRVASPQACHARAAPRPTPFVASVIHSQQTSITPISRIRNLHVCSSADSRVSSCCPAQRAPRRARGLLVTCTCRRAACHLYSCRPRPGRLRRGAPS